MDPEVGRRSFGLLRWGGGGWRVGGGGGHGELVGFDRCTLKLCKPGWRCKRSEFLIQWRRCGIGVWDQTFDDTVTESSVQIVQEQHARVC